jgi:hypothetical protein
MVKAFESVIKHLEQHKYTVTNFDGSPVDPAAVRHLLENEEDAPGDPLGHVFLARQEEPEIDMHSFLVFLDVGVVRFALRLETDDIDIEPSDLCLLLNELNAEATGVKMFYLADEQSIQIEVAQIGDTYDPDSVDELLDTLHWGLHVFVAAVAPEDDEDEEDDEDTEDEENSEKA